jgi:hypothetical protein
MIKKRIARATDAERLAPRLRVADRQEIKAVSGEDPLAALERSVSQSRPCHAIAIEPEDQPLALFGVVPHAESRNLGFVWLLGSADIDTHSFVLLRMSRECVESLQDHYAILWTLADARNRVHLRWLEWCGFTALRLIEQHGVEQRPFYQFVRKHRVARHRESLRPSGALQSRGGAVRAQLERKGTLQ